MDVGHFSSCAEAHVDLEAMMMQMEKLYDFPSEAPPPASSIMEFPMGTPLNPFINTLSATAPGSTIRTPPATAPLTGVAAHQNLASVPSVQSNSASSHSETACDAGPLRRQQPAPMAAMREMAFHIAAMQPIHIDPESVRPPKRRNVRISKDPQSVAARHRRERISERIRILQRLVPGGTKMDTASMLDEAIHYVKFLKTQVQSLEKVAAGRNAGFGFGSGLSPAAAVSSTGFSCCLGSRSS